MSGVAAEVRRAVEVLSEPGDVREIRALKNGTTASGYFDDLDALAREAAKLEEQGYTIYLTANPVNPALLARAENKIKHSMRETTSDRDVEQRRWILIDHDPERPSGVSATDSEKKAALWRAREVRDHLKGEGWPDPIVADSGNGAHLLYAVDLPNDRVSLELVRGVLEALSFKFSDEAVKVDTGMANAARITKLYGSMARKGDSTEDRPHRRSKLLKVPGEREEVSRAQLQAVADTRPEEPRRERGQRTRSAFDLEAWITEHAVPIKRQGPWQGGHRFILEECPWAGHRDNSAYIVQFPNGAVSAGCHHDSCQGKGWREFREHFEPGAYKRDGHGESSSSSSSLRGNYDDDARDGRREPLTVKAFRDLPKFSGPRPYVVEGLFPERFPTTLYGDGGVAKSIIALSLGQGVARGADTWLGHEIERKRNCLFLDFELDEEEQARRALQLARGEGFADSPEGLFYLCAAGRSTKEVFGAAFTACEERGVEVVILDSVGVALEGDAGSGKDVIDFFRHLDHFRALGVAVLLVDHQAKLQTGESYQSKTAFGSSYKGHLSRSRIQAEAKERGQGTLAVVLRQNKTNFGALQDPFRVKLTFTEERITLGREELAEEDLRTERSLNASDRVLLALKDGPAFPQDLSEPTGLQTGSAKNALTKLRRTGLIEETGEIQARAKQVRLTPAGEKHVGDYLGRSSSPSLPPKGDDDDDDNDTPKIPFGRFGQPLTFDLTPGESATVSELTQRRNGTQGRGGE